MSVSVNPVTQRNSSEDLNPG